VFTLPNLPYAYDALQPTMSDKTLHHHHDKHHAKYVDTLNTLLKDKAGLGDEPLEAVIAQAREGDKKLFNNAAQAWNHGFFWECLSPEAGQRGFEGGDRRRFWRAGRTEEGAGDRGRRSFRLWLGLAGP
jgi:Fe-Mn family superoxide dismutase